MPRRCTSLVLTVEIIAGTSDEQAAVELQMMATDMGCIVEAMSRETPTRKAVLWRKRHKPSHLSAITSNGG